MQNDQSGVFISSGSLRGASHELQLGILGLLGLAATPEASPEDILVHESDGEAFVMDTAFAKRFLEKCSFKTRKTLSVIVEHDGQFEYDEIEEAVGLGSLRGVWTGITNRLRNLTADPTAKMFDWVWDDAVDGWVGKMDPTSVISLQKAL